MRGWWGGGEAMDTTYLFSLTNKRSVDGLTRKLSQSTNWKIKYSIFIRSGITYNSPLTRR